MVPICKTCSNKLSFFKKEAELEGGVLPEESWSSSAASSSVRSARGDGSDCEGTGALNSCSEDTGCNAPHFQALGPFPPPINTHTRSLSLLSQASPRLVSLR